MPSSTQANVYMLTTIEFDVGGQHVKLYGAIQADPEDLYFVLADKLNPPLLPDGDATTSISQPFGMTGVELTNFSANAHIYKQSTDGSVTFDFTLLAVVRFLSPKISWQLTGALAFEKSTPRLAYVALDASKPLTLTDFVQSVIGGDWSWTDDVTKQIAFQDGHMYYLNGADSYTFQYTGANGQSQSIVCSRGYHVSTTIQLFNDPKYDFEIDLSVVPDDKNKNTINLKTTAKKSFGFDFVQLNNLTLEISTGKNTFFRISATAVVLGTTINNISAEYSGSTFTGTVSIEGVIIQLAFSTGIIRGTVNVDSIGFTVVFQLTRGEGADSNFTIIEITGIPQCFIDVMKIYEALNKISGSGCEKLVDSWFNDMSKTKLTPSLDKSQKPYKSGGQMHVPLLLDYEIDFAGNQIADAQISFTAIIDIPDSIKSVPEKIAQSIIHSTETIVSQIISDPQTYKAIAMAIAHKVGGKALARFICRALEKFEDVAKELAERAGEVAVETLADAAELAGALMAVSLLGVKVILNLFEKAWDEVKSWFTGGKTEKEKAEDKVRDIQRQIEGVVAGVNTKITSIKLQIADVSLKTSLNEQNQFVANLTWNVDIQSKLDAGSSLIFTFHMLTGKPGASTGRELPGTLSPNTNFPVVKNWSDIPDNSQYQMNASVQSYLSGFTFMNSNTKGAITNAITKLQEFVGDSDAARDFQNYLKDRLKEFEGYNTVGIQSDWVYAQSDTPIEMRVGASRIGINTRISG